MDNRKVTINKEFGQKTSEKLTKDIKMCLSTLVCVMLVLVHYVWVMKQLIDYPDLGIYKMFLIFGLWGVNFVATVYCWMFKIYPTIYCDDADYEKEAKKRKSD